MRSLARFLIRLYPSNWRARYGEEFQTLLEDSSPDWPAVYDLLKGAIRMQLSLPAFPKLALMLSLTGLLAGILIAYMLPPIYVSESELMLESLNSGPALAPRGLAEYLIQLENQVLSRTSLSNIIQDPRLDLYGRDRAGKPLEDVIEAMRTKDIRIRVDSHGHTDKDRVAFSVAFAYPDQVKARDTLQALITQLMEVNLNRQRTQTTAGQPDQFHRLEARVALLEKRFGIPPAPPEPGDRFASNVPLTLAVLDPPSLPVYPTKPNRSMIMAAGFVAGLVLASFIAIFRRRPPAIPLPAQPA